MKQYLIYGNQKNRKFSWYSWTYAWISFDLGWWTSWTWTTTAQHRKINSLYDFQNNTNVQEIRISRMLKDSFEDCHQNIWLCNLTRTTRMLHDYLINHNTFAKFPRVSFNYDHVKKAKTIKKERQTKGKKKVSGAFIKVSIPRNFACKYVAYPEDHCPQGWG